MQPKRFPSIFFQRIFILKNRLFAVLAIAAICAPLAAHADGTITFNGALSATTCTVTGTGGTSSFAVDLGSPSVAGLQSAGGTTPNTTFNISLSGCAGGTATSVRPYFSGSNINTSGRLVNTFGTGAATNVELQLLDEPADTVIALNAARGSQSSQNPSIAGGSATLQFAARFFTPAGGATAGGFQSDIAYVIDYL
jgi:major type 1 subunit fimbrin (pilin)